MSKEQNSQEENKALHIGDVSESISITKNELQAFLEDWDDGKQNVWDADWNNKSRRIADFLGLIDNVTV